ncbi:MAG: carboxypeptidase regulatory-like domain-containing protein, partial [Flavisolibacter sp.]
MRKLNLCCLFLLLSCFSFAQVQKGAISIRIVNEKDEAVENATVELLRSKDSSLVKTALPNKSGLAEFESIPFNNYLIRVSAVGFTTKFSPAFTLNETATSISLNALKMETKSTQQMPGVTVQAKKPFIQKLSDRIVVNVESSIVSAGSSVLDVLERSPGITIDQNDAISLRGRAGVIIMIDGKPTAMSGADLGNYLRGLPSNAV